MNVYTDLGIGGALYAPVEMHLDNIKTPENA